MQSRFFNHDVIKSILLDKMKILKYKLKFYLCKKKRINKRCTIIKNYIL